VTSAAVERGDLEVSVLATGTINAYKLVSVGARATGEVKRLAVALGDKVKEGQLIAEIDALTQQNALRDAQASLRSAEALLGARQATLVQAELAAKRQRELAAGDAGARADLEAAEATLNTARADVESQRAMVAQARINVDTAQLNLGYARVLAPMDGTVVAIVTEQGQTVNAAQTAPTIIKLARLDTMTIKARISEADVPRVKPGMPVHFSLLGEPDRRIQATLRAVEPGDTTLADSSATTSTSSATSGTTNAIYYNGIFDVPNPDGTLRINMTAQATIVLAQAKAALTIPVAALGAREGSGGDRHKVRVLGADGRIEDRVVRVGLNNRVRAQVLDGLKEGERVVTAEAAPPGAASDGRRPPPRM
jgi:macrolide-specific efflux system membrane fusion protein